MTPSDTLRSILTDRRNLRILAILLVALAAAFGRACPERDEVAAGSPPGSEPGSESRSESGTIERLYEERRSGVVVEIAGEVERTLADDSEGSAHQRFILRLPSGHTVLVSHNIDLAPRVPLARGDPVEIRGQYEWNDRGGVVHWTHHDPQGRRPGGWIRHDDESYR